MVNATFTWEVDPTIQADKLAKGLRNRAMRVAINAASAPMKQEVINAVPVRTASLQKSIRIKVKNYRNANIWVSIIGASSTFKRVRRTGGRKKKGPKRTYIPARYQRLVDIGTKHIRGRHFMQQALEKGRARFQSIFVDRLKREIDVALAK